MFGFHLTILQSKGEKKMKRIRKSFILSLCAMIFVTAGCTKPDVSSAPYKIYYLNAEQTGLVEEAYTGETEDAEKGVEEILKCLQKGTDKIEEQSVIPEEVEILKYLLQDEKLILYFDDDYLKMDMVQEVLCRAALVRSLTQLDGVKLVAFYVNDEPLKNRDGKEYGYFQTDDFVQNTGASINSYEETELKLYFANEKGDKLAVESVIVQHDSNLALEKAIVEQLMRGPSDSKFQRTIPKETRLLGVSIKDGICYLNFDENLKNIVPGVTPEVVIYSIVNSVMESTSVSWVQISINGEKNIMFQESVDLSEALTRNYKLIEE